RQLKSREKLARSKLEASSKQADGQLKSATGQDRTEEQKTRSDIQTPSSTPSPPHTRSMRACSLEQVATQFNAFWRAYPSRSPDATRKEPALAKFQAAIKGGASADSVIAGAERYAKYVASERTDPRYIAQAVTWLNQQRWTEPYTLRGQPANMPMVFEG